MKFILIFMLCLFTRSCYGLRASQHYKFSYFSSFKTGIPQDGDQAVGVSLKAVLDVFLESQDGIAIFKLSDINTVEFLEDLGCDQQTEFPSERFQPPKDNVFLSALEQPFRANLRGSQPFSIEYEETDHRWLSNLRKGIANVFKNEILKGNFETPENESISSFFHEGHSVNVFSVEEETIFGICKVSYEIHEIEDGFIWAESDFLPTRESDSEEGLWRVVRSVNFDKCKDKVTLNIHSINEKRNKEEKLSYTRSSVSTYVLRGSPGHFDLHSAVIEGIMTFPLSPFDEHEAHSTTKQKLLLIDQTENEEIPALGSNLKRSTTWMYLVWSSFTLPKDSKPVPWIVYSDENNFNEVNEIYGSRSISSNQISHAKVQILETIETASKVLTDINYDTNESQWRTVPDTLNMLTYYFKLLNKEDILKIFQHIYKKDVKLEWRLVIDSAAASGSYNAYEAIMDYISEDKLEDFQIRNVFSTLGSSQGALNITRMLNFILGMKPSQQTAWSGALLNFAHYISEFCIHKNHNYNPATEYFIEDCDSVSREFKSYLFQIILNETFTWERAFAIRVFEELKDWTNFNPLNNIIDGTCNITSSQLRAMALRGLKNPTPHRDQKQSLYRKPAMDLLKDVYTNFNEDFEVRAAALASYLTWQPSTSFWYKLAQSTWHEPSEYFSSFTSYLIKHYAEEKVPALEKQWRDAYSASKLAKTPVNHQDHPLGAAFDFLFRNFAKISVRSSNDKNDNFIENQIIEVLTKEKGFNLLKFESYFVNSIPKSNDKRTHTNDFFEKFLKEISQEYHPYFDRHQLQSFIQILGDSLITIPPRMLFEPINFKTEGRNTYYAGRFLKFLEKTDFFPNELGLPTFTFSGIPTIFSLMAQTPPPNSGHSFSSRFLVRASAVYNRGAGVYLPWSIKSHTVMVRSNVELNIPVGDGTKEFPAPEGTGRTTKNLYFIAFEKKFPVFRASNTPMAMVFNMDSDNQDPQLIFIPIKKFKIKEKIISEIHSLTGIKYELQMRGDTDTDFSLRDFQRFPKVPFRFWNLEFYINVEESETKELETINFMGSLIKQEGETDKSLDSNQKNPTISNSDTFVERSEKLTNVFGKSLEYMETKFNLIGEKKRSFEIFFAIDSKSFDGKKIRVGFTRSPIPGGSTQPASLCIDFRGKPPSRAERDSAFISQTNLSQEVDAQFLFNCSQNILNAHGLFSKSEKGKEESSRKCDKKHEIVEEIYSNRNLFLDTIQIDATYPTYNESYDFVLTKDIFGHLKNWINFPSIKIFTDETHRGNVTLRFHRSNYDHNWSVYLTSSSGAIHLATFSDNISFKLVSFLLTSIIEIPSDYFWFQSPKISHAKCSLQRNSVTTFDGVHYNYQPSTCWTLASHSRTREFRSKNKNAILIRYAKEPSKVPDFKFFKFESKVEIEFSNDELKLNGTVVDRLSDNSTNLKTIEEGLIYKSEHHYIIFSNPSANSPSIIVSNDKLQIYEDLGRTLAIGLCGNNDGRTNKELIGPKHCIYKDPKLFAASWTGQSDTCDAAALGEYRTGVQDYQAECKTYQKHEQDVKMNKRCLSFGFKVSAFDEDKFCISGQPLPFCTHDCQPQSYKRVKVPFKCWPKEMAPQILRQNIEKKVTHVFEAVVVEPHFYEDFYVDVATLCKKF